MRRYETTFIVNPQADDAAIDQQVTAVIDLIKADGGQIVHENRIGTRRLAFPVQGLIQGYYASLIFDAETTVLARLDRMYKLEEPYIRYLTIRFEGDLPGEQSAGHEGQDDQAESSEQRGGSHDSRSRAKKDEPARKTEAASDEDEDETEDQDASDDSETDDEEL